MPSLITKWKKDKPYLYWVRSARVNGQSRIVEQLYLGPRERVMEQIRAQFTSSPPPDQLPQLHTVQTREFGASALFYSLAQELGLVELLNAHIPPAPPGRRTSLSVGHYLTLAAINRAIWPKSKRAFAEWYRGTVLARLVPAPSAELDSRRFWDHMDLVEADQVALIQKELLATISQRFPLGERFLVYDTTNYYTFIHTFNRRPRLPQRGKNKQRRADLRQVSLALVVDEQRGLPLYYRCYEGNTTDVVALGPSLAGMVGQFLPQQAAARLTLVLDKGNVSLDNFKALKQAQFSFIAAIPAGWVRRLYQVSLQEYQALGRLQSQLLSQAGAHSGLATAESRAETAAAASVRPGGCRAPPSPHRAGRQGRDHHAGVPRPAPGLLCAHLPAAPRGGGGSELAVG